MACVLPESGLCLKFDIIILFRLWPSLHSNHLAIGTPTYRVLRGTTSGTQI